MSKSDLYRLKCNALDYQGCEDSASVFAPNGLKESFNENENDI